MFTNLDFLMLKPALLKKGLRLLFGGFFIWRVYGRNLPYLKRDCDQAIEEYAMLRGISCRNLPYLKRDCDQAIEEYAMLRGISCRNLPYLKRDCDPLIYY